MIAKLIKISGGSGKDGGVSLVIVVAASREQSLEIARREKDTDRAEVIDASEVIFAD